MSVFASIETQAQTDYPKPVSEYAEETGPGSMAFLSYPKYYKNAAEMLVPVNPNLVIFSDPAWDYEVSAGIWQLRVRKDGTFQASHKGDAFTYRFASLGFGRGSAYQKVELGEPDFSRVSVLGDTVRWMDVYPDVDVSVRYIHDILKVDVKLKKSFMADLKAEVKAGHIDREQYLTARFDMPQALVRSTAKQNGKVKDLYAEAVDVDAPITFEKDGKEVHKLRPVETYLLDEKGEPVYDMEHPVRSKQTWVLKKNAPGAAEMSANVGDLAELPEGDVVMDPALVFHAGVATAKDTRLSYQNPTANYGGSYYLDLNAGQTYSDRILFGFNVANALPAGVIINSASLRLQIYNQSVANPPLAARLYKVTDYWFEYGATYNSHNNAYLANGVYDESFTITQPGNYTVNFNATVACKAHILSTSADIYNKGFLLKFDNYANETVSFYSQADTAYRPQLHVKYSFIQFGADPGNPTSDAQRIQKAKDDHLKVVRIFSDSYWDNTISMVQRAQERGMKVILPFIVSDKDGVLFKSPISGYASCNWKTWTYRSPGTPTPTPGFEYCGECQFGDLVMYRLQSLENTLPGVLGNTVIAVQIGNEEDVHQFKDPSTLVIYQYPNQRYYAGRIFARYYLNARDKIKARCPFLDVISGCIEDHKTLGHTTGGVSSGSDIPNQYRINDNGWSACAFLNGFFQEIKKQSNPVTGIHKMPDIIDIHGYVGKEAPEFIQDIGSGNTHEWLKRLDQLDVICNFYNLHPNYSDTEWGFSNNPSIDWGCIGANTKTQAVYYLRAALMNGTMKGTNGSSIWNYSSYWSHYTNGGFTAWYADPYYTAPWHIQQVGSVLHDDSADIYPGLQQSSIWKPASSVRNEIVGNLGGDNLMTCGWINPRNQKWGAIWRYKNNPTPGQIYWKPTITPTPYVFEAPGPDNPGNALLYKFLIPATPPPTPSPLWTQVCQTPIVPTPAGGNYYYPIPPTYVNEEPAFLRFLPTPTPTR